MTTKTRATGPAEVAPGAMPPRGRGNLHPLPESRLRGAVIEVIALDAAAHFLRDRRTWQHVIMFTLVVAAAKGLVRDSQVFPHAFKWLWRPPARGTAQGDR